MTGKIRSILTPILIGLSLSCSAQTFPNKPIRVIVGFPAGGSTDFVTRAMSDQMSIQMGQPIVVDNRPGAGGLIGLDAVLKKVAEESGETLIAAKEAQHGGELAAVVRETADLWFHSMVMLSVLGLRSGDVIAELEKRFGLSGIAEKAARHAGSDSTRDA